MPKKYGLEVQFWLNANIFCLKFIDEEAKAFLFKTARGERERKLMDVFLQSTKGFECMLSNDIPNGEKAWVVPNARYCN